MTARVMLVALALGACGGASAVDAGDGGTGGAGGSAPGGAGAGGAGGAGGVGGAGGSGGPSAHDYYSCSAPAECLVTSKGCCPSCGEPDLAWVIGVKAELGKAYHEEACIGSTGCGLCMPPPQPNITAVCRQDKCTAIDIRIDELSTCTTNEDCRLRWGAVCCESCNDADWNLVAVSKLIDFEAAMCGATKVCDACATKPYPLDQVAACTNGHCQVEAVK